jgi:hypothetical protein
MRRLTRVVAIAVVIVATLTLSLAPASEAHGDGSSGPLTINRTATLWAIFPNTHGLWITVWVRCSGGTGMVTATATQSSSQSNTGSSDTVPGFPGDSQVKCDGVSRQVALSYLGEGNFNLGYASITATLMPPSGPSTTELRTVRVVNPTS